MGKHILCPLFLAQLDTDPLAEHCKFLHLTDANFLYSLYIYKPNWYIRLANLDPQRNPTPEGKILVVTFKASEIKRFLWHFFFKAYKSRPIRIKPH